MPVPELDHLCCADVGQVPGGLSHSHGLTMLVSSSSWLDLSGCSSASCGVHLSWLFSYCAVHDTNA